MRIAFSGHQQVGKTTVARYLWDRYDIPLYSFADPLKLALVKIGIDPERLYGRKDRTSRRLMQLYGQAMREQDSMYWADQMQLVIPQDGDAVVDDLRMQNEAESLKALGFKLVRVETKLERGNDGDISETDLDTYGEWDATLVASRGDIEALYYQIDTLIATWEREGSLI